MQAFIDFLVNNYLWFLVISLILIFALIGYLVDTSAKNKTLEVRNMDQPTNLNQDSNSSEDIKNNSSF